MGLLKVVDGTFIKRTMESHSALCVIGICGLVGISLDIDHLIAFLLGWSLKDYRWLHMPVFIVCCVCLCFVSAYLGRLFVKLVLKERKGGNH